MNDVISRLVVLKAGLRLDSGLEHFCQTWTLDLLIRNSAILKLSLCSSPHNAVAAPHTSQDLQSYFTKDRTIKAS